MSRADFPFEPPPPLLLRGRPKRIAVVGAGLAGLAAALELHGAGHAVLVLEARGRSGGRVFTLRQPFSAGVHAEAGASWFPAAHPLPLFYARRFGLPLLPAPQGERLSLTRIAGRLLAPTSPGWQEVPLPLTDEERALGPLGLVRRHLVPVARQLAGGGLSAWEESDLDSASLGDFLRRQGASHAVVDLLQLGPLGLTGEGLESVSALAVLRDLGVYLSDPRCFSLAGGNDQLPRALARPLGERLRLGQRVVRLEQTLDRVTVTVQGRDSLHQMEFDYLLCTLPASVLRHLDIYPPLRPPLATRIADLDSTSVTLFYAQAPASLWGGAVYIGTDLPLGLVEGTGPLNQAGDGVLRSLLAGRRAREVRSLTEAERRGLALAGLNSLFPGVEESCRAWCSWSWDEDVHARGAYSWFRPGQVRLAREFPASEGRIFFAGEHLSPWPGWTQGALASGLRAARLIHEAP